MGGDCASGGCAGDAGDAGDAGGAGGGGAGGGGAAAMLLLFSSRSVRKTCCFIDTIRCHLMHDAQSLCPPGAGTLKWLHVLLCVSRSRR